MSTTTNKSKFNDSLKKAGQKTKEFAKKKADSVKNYGKKYADDIKTAYNIGYANGWDTSYEIPKRFCSKLAAALGYRKGVIERKKADKYVKRYSHQGKQKYYKEN